MKGKYCFFYYSIQIFIFALSTHYHSYNKLQKFDQKYNHETCSTSNYAVLVKIYDKLFYMLFVIDSFHSASIHVRRINQGMYFSSLIHKFERFGVIWDFPFAGCDQMNINDRVWSFLLLWLQDFFCFVMCHDRINSKASISSDKAPSFQ